MRRFMILFFVFSTVTAFAKTWNDLELLSEYKLTQSFELPQVERSSSLLHFIAGDDFLLKEMTPLPEIKVMVYTLKYKNCPGRAMNTTLEIIPVQATSGVIEVGAQLETNCELNVYIEAKDIFTTSFFE